MMMIMMIIMMGSLYHYHDDFVDQEAVNVLIIAMEKN